VNEHKLCRYKLDSTFLHLPVSEALEHLQNNLAKTREKVEALEDEKRTCAEEMEKLKKVLYQKFGSKYSKISFLLFTPDDIDR